MATILKSNNFVYIETDEDYHIAITKVGDNYYLDLEDGSIIFIGDKPTAAEFFKAVISNFNM